MSVSLELNHNIGKPYHTNTHTHTGNTKRQTPDKTDAYTHTHREREREREGRGGGDLTKVRVIKKRNSSYFCGEIILLRSRSSRRSTISELFSSSS